MRDVQPENMKYKALYASVVRWISGGFANAVQFLNIYERWALSSLYEPMRHVVAAIVGALIRDLQPSNILK